MKVEGWKVEDLKRIIGLEPNQQNYRLLVVEDKWENRQLLVKLLSSVGFEVREAINGQEAFVLWSSWEPHLIWMDMQMPVWLIWSIIFILSNSSI